MRQGKPESELIDVTGLNARLVNLGKYSDQNKKGRLIAAFLMGF